jgi:hypothetical protein
MKTDDLIDMLGTNLEPVKGGQLRNAFFIALAVGGVGAFCLMLVVLGPPMDVPGGYLSLKVVALAFTLGLVAAGAIFLINAARPVEPVRGPLIVVGLLFLAILAGGIAALLMTRPTAWSGMVFGPQWAACAFCIPLFAIAPFAALVLALRRGAPTNLPLTGAITGLVAGAVGAVVFALHHPGGSIPFIALWYTGPIVLCALAGAILGPRFLRW